MINILVFITFVFNAIYRIISVPEKVSSIRWSGGGRNVCVGGGGTDRGPSVAAQRVSEEAGTVPPGEEGLRGWTMGSPGNLVRSKWKLEEEFSA